jgi:hypothetical protein
MSKNLVSVNDCDYLEEDPELRGQKYCCLSFLSPEKILENKEVFRFNKFTDNFSKDINELFHNMKQKYPDDADAFQSIADKYRFLFNKKHLQDEYKYFIDEKSEEIDKEFSNTVDFQTNVRGIKVRGSYDSMREAQIRSEVLKRKDKNHNIFIAQVGCWCPWDPCADQIDDQHYGEDQLNTLMKKYRENQSHKDEVFDERKDKMLQAQKENNEKILKQNELKEEDVKDSVNEVLELNINENNNVNEDLKTEDNVISSSGIGEDNKINENYNINSNPDVNEKVFGVEDPWMKSKENVEEVD